MESTFNSNAAPSLLAMRDVVRAYCVSETTIRRATSNGSLSCLTLPSGHRRFRESDILTWLGIEAGEKEAFGDRIPIACVIRVSSTSQNRKIGNSDKSSLQHQEDRVRDYAINRWGANAQLTWYRSVGSGMNFERKEFIKLIQDVLEGKYRYIVATDFTRICRFGIKMIEFIAKQGNCEIQYTMGNEDKDIGDNLTEEILSILCHYTAKASGAKQKAFNQTKMSEDQLKDSYQWYKSGYSYRAIVERLKKEGRGLNEAGKVVSRHVVFKRLQDNWAALEKLYGNEGAESNSFEVYCAKFVRKSKGAANGKATRLSRKKLVASYEGWANKEGLPIMSARKISVITKQQGWERRLNAKGSVVFIGLSLNTNKS